MSGSSKFLGLAGLLLLQAAACKPEVEEFAPARLPKPVAFEGKVDARYAGTWVAKDGSSTLLLTQDGAVNITTISPSSKGRSVSSVAGTWAATPGSLLFKYSQAGRVSVVRYTAKLTGGSLGLSAVGQSHPTVYERKRA